ncbi:MAG: MBL fold metallo-hydrolase [Christensenellaceae bacterium]|nr:MBL fold metallo-hydrolase [Christensenellaceae bacterium]
MKIYYLKNSGFAVISKSALLVFDYYKLSPENGGFTEGVVPKDALLDFDRVYFFVSHKHEDHFNKGIFDLDINPNTKYIVSAGTPKGGRTDIRFALKEGDTYEDDYLKVYAGGSTDIGVSFAVDVDGKRIFHAGDLNCWHWTGEWSKQEELNARHLFTKALGRLKGHAENTDVAFFPVDPRMQGPYDDGAKEFIKKFSPKYFVPMHCMNKYDVIDKFASENSSETTRVLTYHSRGELISVF